MNLRLRWLLALGSLILYGFIPSGLSLLWALYLLTFSIIFALRNLGSLLITLFIMSLLLIPAQLYQTTPVGFLKIWFAPVIPLSFLFPDLNRTLDSLKQPNHQARYRAWLGLSGLSTFLGNGAFQIVHAISVLLFGKESRNLMPTVLRSPTLFIPLLWLATGLVLRVVQQGDLKHLSTSASWLWAPLLCLIFGQLNSTQLKHYLRFTLAGLILSSGFGLIVYFVNPPLDNTFLKLLPSISSLHQGMLPGSPDRFAVGGFFFHRLKFAHICLVLLPVVAMAGTKTRVILSLGFVATAIVLSQAVWATVILAGIVAVYGVLFIWRRPPLELLFGLALALTLGIHGLLASQSDLDTHVISKSPSLQTRQFMAKQVTALVADNPLGLGHGGYKTWSIENYPADMTNRQLPRTLPHNLGFASLIETGVIGWSLIVGLLAYLLTLSASVLERSVTSETANLLALTVGGGTIALLGLGMLHDPLYHKPVAFGFMTIIGLGHALRRNHSI